VSFDCDSLSEELTEKEGFALEEDLKKLLAGGKNDLPEAGAGQLGGGAWTRLL